LFVPKLFPPQSSSFDTSFSLHQIEGSLEKHGGGNRGGEGLMGCLKWNEHSRKPERRKGDKIAFSRTHFSRETTIFGKWMFVFIDSPINPE